MAKNLAHRRSMERPPKPEIYIFVNIAKISIWIVASVQNIIFKHMIKFIVIWFKSTHVFWNIFFDNPMAQIIETGAMDLANCEWKYGVAVKMLNFYICFLFITRPSI